MDKKLERLRLISRYYTVDGDLMICKECKSEDLEEFSYSEIFYKSPDPIMMLEVVDGMPTRYLDVNDAYAEQIGYTREDCKHLNPYNIMPKEFHQRLPKIMENLNIFLKRNF